MDLSKCETLNPIYNKELRSLELHLEHGKANEMGSEQLFAWEQICEILEKGEVRSLFTTSQRKSRSGKSIFIAGANVTERSGWTDAQVKAHVQWQREVLMRLRRVPCFHICLVDGIALGWGTEFLLTADYRITTPNATFGLPETGLGILPGAGGTSELWMEIGIAHALRLGMAGERIGSQEATRIGLTQESVDSWDTGKQRATQLMQSALTRSPTAAAAFKSALLQSKGLDTQQRVEREGQAYNHCVDTGEAQIGRQHFKEILKGEIIEWGSFTSLPKKS